MKKSTRSQPAVNPDQISLSLDSSTDWMVYVLCDPRVEDPIQRIRYVGITTKTVERRLQEHLAGARKGGRTHKCRWIQQLLAADLLPVVEEVDPGNAGRPWERSEIAWIEYYREQGCRLTNGCAGGRGVLNPTEETRLNHAEAMRKLAANPEWRKKNSEGARKRSADPEWRRKNAEAQKAACASPEVRAKMSAAAKVAWASPEARERQSAASKAAWARPEARERHSAAAKAAWARRKAMENATLDQLRRVQAIHEEEER